MSRKPVEMPVEPVGKEYIGHTPAEVAETEIRMRNRQTELDEVLNAGIDLGRIEALDFVATVANSSILPIYENVKKTKAWQFLRNPQNGHGGHFESLEEFCEVKLGKSYRRLRAIAANRNAIGQDAFEQAEKLGLRQIDYNAIKALPAPKQEIIREALTEGADLETVTRALRQLAAEDQREIEALTNERNEIRANLATKEDQLASKDRKLNELDAKLNKATKRIQVADPDAQGAQLREETGLFAFEAEATILGKLTPAFEALYAHAEQNNCTHEEFMAGCLCQIERALNGLRSRFGVKAAPDGSEIPDWQNPDVVARADAIGTKMVAELNQRINGGLNG